VSQGLLAHHGKERRLNLGEAINAGEQKSVSTRRKFRGILFSLIAEMRSVA
jgi:hypothetical protein